MNKQETAIILRILRSNWPNEKVNEDTVTIWTWAFEDVPYSVVEDAMKRYVKTGKFFPKPAELLEIIGVQNVAPNLIPEAAWAEVLKEARRVGVNRLPLYQGGKIIPPPEREFSHPAIDQAVQSVGWRAICLTPEEERSYLRDAFVKALKALITRDIRNVQTGDAPLPIDEPAIVAIEGGKRKGEVA